MHNELWDSFFGNPLIASYIEEMEQAAQPEQGSQPAQPDQPGGETDIEGLTKDFQDGHITQDDLINMYKSGKISQDDVQQIVQGVEGQGEGPAPEDGEGPTEEELFAQQIDQTNDLFIKFTIYDKINELTEKLDYFKDNFEDTKSSIYNEVLQLREFLNILSNLVFNIETSVAYQMYGSILLQLTELFSEYNKINK